MKIESTLHPIHAKRSNLNTMIYRPVFLNVFKRSINIFRREAANFFKRFFAAKRWNYLKLFKTFFAKRQFFFSDFAFWR